MASASSLGLTAVASSGCTAGLVLTLRSKLLWFFSDDTLVSELSERGVDLANQDVEGRIERTYEKLDSLGKGASGIVYRVRKREESGLNLDYAMKVMEKGSNSMNDEESLLNEIKCMRRLRHRNIVNLIDVVESKQKMWIFMDLAVGGGLYERILQMDHFSEHSAATIIKQVLKAVHYMHSMGVVHRDLKPENVLLESKDMDSADIKIADFGLAVDMGWNSYCPRESMKLKSSTEIRGGFCGSPICMAPEVAVKSARYGPQCDLWSIGCMSYEMLSGSPPFTAKTAKALFKIVRESEGPSFSEECWPQISAESREIVGGMLKKSPVERPSAREAMHHRWFLCAKDHHLKDTHDTLKSRKTRTTKDDGESSDDELADTLTGEEAAKSLGLNGASMETLPSIP